MAAQSTSIVESMRGYPAPYFLDSFELRREVDPGLEEEAMVKDILKGIVKRWKTYSEVVSLSCDAGGRMPKRFCAPVSFQRPKWIGKRGHSQAGVYTSRIEGRRFRSRRCADPGNKFTTSLPWYGRCDRPEWHTVRRTSIARWVHLTSVGLKSHTRRGPT